MAQRGRCPGGRPSVSANKGIHDANYSGVKWPRLEPKWLRLTSINTSRLIGPHQSTPLTCHSLKHCAHSPFHPQGFTAYCTISNISNTVKAIGIGGTASICFSSKVTPFLTQSREAMARNIVALTRSKGLCVLLLPSFFFLMAAWLNEVVVRAVALLSALTKEFTMQIILE